LIEAHTLSGDRRVPNNRLPLLLYRHALAPAGAELPADEVRNRFRRHGWRGAWVNGIYDFLHYHSTAHEVLGCFRGSARVRFGGDAGITVEFRAGDAVLIPAGVSHQNLGATADFRVVGAYPPGQDPDMCHGREGERPEADRNIERVPIPSSDPVLGGRGGLIELWR